MKKIICCLLYCCSFMITLSQNVGLGTTNPTHARLEINGTVGAAVAMFGADKYGVTIEADNPEVGFNYFFNNGTKTIKAGYGAVIGMNPGSGELYIGNFNGNQSSADYGTITGYRQNFSLFQNGELRIAGSSNFTHFFFGPNEDTYIRGGKDFSNVIINDINGGRVGIGTTALESQTMLTIKAPQFYGGIDVTANGGATGAIYAHGLNGAPALYLDGPLKVNTLAANRTAYRLAVDYLNPGVDGYVSGFNTANHYAGTDILINNNLSNNDPNALIFYAMVDAIPQNGQDTYHSYLLYGGDNKWHIRYEWDKPGSGSVFVSYSRINILIIKTN